MENRKRNTAILLISTGLFLLLGKVMGFFTITGFFIIWIAVIMFRKDETRTGYILLATGILFIANKMIMFFVFLFFLAIMLLVYYYFKSTKSAQQIDDIIKRFSILESWKQNAESWVLNDASRWGIIGEINLDLSLAISDNDITTLKLEGVIGDVDIIVPEDMGLLVEASILLGEVKIGSMSESGAMNTINWQSKNYDHSEYKVILKLNYIIGDIDIKLL